MILQSKRDFLLGRGLLTLIVSKSPHLTGGTFFPARGGVFQRFHGRRFDPHLCAHGRLRLFPSFFPSLKSDWKAHWAKNSPPPTPVYCCAGMERRRLWPERAAVRSPGLLSLLDEPSELRAVAIHQDETNFRSFVRPTASST